MYLSFQPFLCLIGAFDERIFNRRFSGARKGITSLGSHVFQASTNPTAQIAFKSEHEKYTGDFDTLITFLKSGTFTVVKAIGSAPDSLIETIGKIEAEMIALKQGLIQRDTIQISVIDSLFYKGYPVDSLRYVPFTDGYEFELGAGEIQTGSKVRVRVFEAKVPYDILLAGLDPQLIINYKEEREKITGYPGLKVGSLEEATNNAGNWE